MEGDEVFSYPCADKADCPHYKPNGKYVELAKEHCANCKDCYLSEVPYELFEGMVNKDVYK